MNANEAFPPVLPDRTIGKDPARLARECVTRVLLCVNRYVSQYSFESEGRNIRHTKNVLFQSLFALASL